MLQIWLDGISPVDGPKSFPKVGGGVGSKATRPKYAIYCMSSGFHVHRQILTKPEKFSQLFTLEYFLESLERSSRLAAHPWYRTPGRVQPGPVPRRWLSPRVRSPQKGGSKKRGVRQVPPRGGGWGGVSFTEKQGCRISPRGIGEGMWGSGRSAGPPVLEHEGEEGLTLLRSSSCCCSNSGTAAMATRASSRGRLAVRGKKRLGRRRLRGASQGRPRPRLRQPPCPTAAGGLRTPPPSQQPRERPAARHVLPQSGLPRPRCRPSWSRAKKLRVAYPRSGPRGNRRPQGREKDSEQRVLAQQGSS